MSTPVIAAEGLTAGYGTTEVVRDLDLDVRPGEVVALLGANCAGKTTTLLTLAGELPPLGGVVRWQGDIVTSPLHRRTTNGLGLVTEQRAVLMGLTTAENFRVSRCDVDLALRLFPELTTHLGRRVGQLSGGQQQMVALARALARRPSLLLIDELSLGLAPIVVDRLLLEVRAAADRGLGVLVVEQHVHKVLPIADRIYVLRTGEVVLAGAASELRGSLDEIQQAYFSVPARAD